MNMILNLLLIPVVTAAICAIAGRRKAMEKINVAGAFFTFLAGMLAAYSIFKNGPMSEYNLLYADAMSAFMVFLITLIGLAVSIYSVGYMGRELDSEVISIKQLRIYYTLFHAFIFTMLLVVVSDNLGVMWIAIEGTTLASAFLVGLYNEKPAVEAAWKYVITCTVGITLALLGTILLYTSSVSEFGETSNALNWSFLIESAAKLDPTLVKLAFIFIIVGYGTKVGLVPMHSWLPDAYSQAPLPVSVLLSAGLESSVMYGIIRYHLITTKALGTAFSGNLLIAFGLLSIIVASLMMLLQTQYKRLLAYSSIEHMGIIALGIGFGGWLGIMGAFLHMFNHAIAKSLMFFSAGYLKAGYNTKNMAEVKGVLQAMPYVGVLLLLGTFALTGSPPFAMFLSEFSILAAGFQADHFIAGTLFLLSTIAVFCGFLYHIGNMVFGEAPAHVKKITPGLDAALVLASLLLLSALLGAYIPGPLMQMIQQI
jgi:hydrogenase-4 component F